MEVTRDDIEQDKNRADGDEQNVHQIVIGAKNHHIFEPQGQISCIYLSLPKISIGGQDPSFSI